MKKIISFMCIFGAIGSAESVQMTPQIQRLMEEKQAKIAELEKCDSKRKGFVIAGVSTLGLTAVGIGGNIALAQKNKKLDVELDSKKTELAGKRNELISLQNQRLQEQLAQQLEQQKQACNAKGAPYQWTTNGECRIVYDAEKAIAVLKAKNDTHDVTKQKFCSLKGKASEFEYFVNQDDYNNVYMQDNFWDAINYAAGLGAWCVYAKADWQVVIQGNGWRCSCKNIPDIVCNSDIETIKLKKDLMIEQPGTEIEPRRTATDWSVLNGDDRPYDVTKEEFCKEASKGSIKGTIAPSLSDASFLFAQQRAVGYRYWCSLLKGKWSISEDKSGAKVWACQNIPESACKVKEPLAQKEKSIIGNEMMEENDLFLSSEQVVKKPDNKLCTDSGGAYVLGKCKCPNNNSKLSSDGKSCECINDAVFNEKTKRCDSTKPAGVVEKEKQDQSTERRKETGKTRKQERQEKKDARAAQKEQKKDEKQLCLDTGGWLLLGECKCSKEADLTQSPDKKSCVCNKGVFDPDTKKCLDKTDALLAKYGDKYNNTSDFDITEDNPFLDKRLFSNGAKKIEKEVIEPEEPIQVQQSDAFAKREGFIMGSENSDMDDVRIASNPKPSTQKVTAQANKASNNNQNTKQTPKQEKEQDNANMMTDAEVLQLLQNPDNNAHGVTKEEFCEKASTGGVGKSISKKYIRNNKARLQTMINYGLGHGYWCKKLGANWNVDYDGFGWYWYCRGVSKDNCSDDVSKETVQKSETKDAFADMEVKIKKEARARKNQARANGTAEGYIYFFG